MDIPLVTCRTDRHAASMLGFALTGDIQRHETLIAYNVPDVNCLRIRVWPAARPHMTFGVRIIYRCLYTCPTQYIHTQLYAYILHTAYTRAYTSSYKLLEVLSINNSNYYYYIIIINNDNNNIHNNNIHNYINSIYCNDRSNNSNTLVNDLLRCCLVVSISILIHAEKETKETRNSNEKAT